MILVIGGFPSFATFSGVCPLGVAVRFRSNPGEMGVGVGPVNGLPV